MNGLLRPWLLVLSAFVCFGAFGAWLARTRAVSGQSINGLVVRARDLDLGSPWVNREFPWTLAITNLTDREQAVDRFRVSCGCTRIEPPALRIPAGQTVPVQLTIDLTRASAPSYRAWPLSIDIVPIVKSGLPPLSPWRLAGTVKSAWYLEPQNVDLGELSAGEAALKATTVRLRGHEAIARITPEYDEDLLSVTVTPGDAANYEEDGIDQDGVFGPDQYTNGFDDNGVGGIDDFTELEGPIPYPFPLKGIQVKIRVFEPDSRQIREITVVEDFLWE